MPENAVGHVRPCQCYSHSSFCHPETGICRVSSAESVSFMHVGKRCGLSLQGEQCWNCESHVCGRKCVAEVYRVSSAETVSFMCVEKKCGWSLQGEQCRDCEFHVCGRKGVGGVYRVSSAETVSFMCVEEKMWLKSTGWAVQRPWASCVWKKRCGWSLQGEQCRDCEFHVCEKKAWPESAGWAVHSVNFICVGKKVWWGRMNPLWKQQRELIVFSWYLSACVTRDTTLETWITSDNCHLACVYHNTVIPFWEPSLDRLHLVRLVTV